MSKYKEIQTQIKDRRFICQALDEMAVPYEAAKAGETLILVDWYGQRRPEQADVVVRRQYLSRLSNDLGWAFDPETGTYAEIISEFEGENRIASQVRQRCAYLQLEQLAIANGYTLNVVEERGAQRVFVGGVR